MKTIIILIAKMFLSFIYFFMKLFLPTKQQILFISMQTDQPSLDFQLLQNRIKELKPDIVLINLCKKMNSGLTKKFDYVWYVLRMIRFTFKAMYYLATSKICITETYCVPISFLKHKKNIRIVQIWHASGAVKKFGYQILDKQEGKKSSIAKLMHMHANYDYAIAPSNITKEIFAEAFDMNLEKIKLFGLPRLEYINNSQYDISDEIYQKYPNLKNKKIILYVPTFRKGKNADLHEILNYSFSDEFQMIIKLHPLDKNIVPEEYAIATEYKTYDLIKIADYIITDYSILSIEASILEKPIFLYIYDWEEYNQTRGVNINLLEELSTFTSKSFHDIMKKIIEKDYNIQEIVNYKNKYIEIDIMHAIDDLTNFILRLM